MSIQDAVAQRGDYLNTLRKLRKEAAAEIERLIDILDRTAGDPDLEPEVDDEDGNDLEPTLGSINPTISGSQAQWSFGTADELEEEHDGREPDEDRETEDGRAQDFVNPNPAP